MKPKDLEAVDLVTLSRYDKETGKINFQDASVLEMPVSRDRLINAGVAEKDGSLTEKGLELAKRVCETEKKLQDGVPIEKRKRRNYRAVVEEAGTWYQATVRKKPICTNSEFIFFGKPERGMATLKAEANTFKSNIRKCTEGKFQEVWPHTYRISSLGGLEWILLADRDGKLITAIQAKYFDFVQKRFSKGRFFAKDGTSAVQVRVQNMGLKDDVIAFIMPVDGGIEADSGKVSEA